MKHDEALLQRIITSIDVNYCMGNYELVKQVARLYAEIQCEEHKNNNN